MKIYSIGIDIGTTSTKAIIFSDKGETVHSVSVEYPLLTPIPKAAEQNPDEIVEAVWTTTKRVIEDKKLDPSQIKLIAFSAAMHSLIALDEKGQPLTASITWADQRSEPQARQLRKTNGQQIYENTGTPIHPMSPLIKLNWLREKEPAIFKEATLYVGIKEYVFHKLFGEYVVDYSIASATGLFNIHTLEWDKEALEAAHITKEKLPRPVPTTEIFTQINPEIAKALNISPDTPIVIGANDGCLANLGVNAIDPGVVALTIGTSAALRTVVDKPIVDSSGRTFCYALTENHWVIGGPVNNGGIIYNWMMDELGGEVSVEADKLGLDIHDAITEKMVDIKPGAEGLLFYPYLTGERAPLWNANAKGSFYGLALHHKREHMMRAVLEGINLNIYLVYQTLEEVIGKPHKIQASGGFAQSPFWRQMIADIFNTEMIVSQTVESSALGAVILGRYALGEISSLEEGAKIVETAESNQPNHKQVKVYQDLIPLYKKIGDFLTAGYDDISAFQEKHP